LLALDSILANRYKRAMSIESLSQFIPDEIRHRSGKVFYSGRNAFATESPLYILGVNPGGDPEGHASETVASHSEQVLRSLPADWSAYRDERWKGASPGTFGMQPRVLHLFAALGLQAGQVPCSNLVFVRSAREADMGRELAILAERCWRFHEAVIQRVKPRAILCFGKTAGKYVRGKIGATILVGEFIETNARNWRSQFFRNAEGLGVVVATHPSIADWTALATDPTNLVREALKAI
jgi:uracil DNA glycosylase superfamily protein